jgi:hypothetical protein
VNALPLAHAGHYVADLLTFVPVLVLVVWFLIVSVRDRHRGLDQDDE